MDDAVDAVIREIASKNGVAIGRDDPILMMVTIQGVLATKTMAAHHELLEKHKRELEEIAERWGSDAKDKAERILTAALASSREVMAATMKEGAAAAATAFRAEIEPAAMTVSKSLQHTRQVALLNMAACALTIGAVVLLLVRGIKF